MILTIDFEEGDLSDFDSTTGGEDLAANGSAAMVDSYGMEVTVNDTNSHYGSNSLSIDTDHIRFRFYFDINSLTMADGDDHEQTSIRCDNSYNSVNELCTVRVQKRGSNYQISLNVEDDSDTDQRTTWTTISDAEHYIEVLESRESSDGAADGVARIYIDGVETAGSITDLENYNIFPTIDEVRFGSHAGIDSGTSGSYYLDDLIIRNDDTEIGPAGDVTVSPSAVSCIASSVAPTVVLGSTTATPAASSCIASSVAPTVVLGSISLSPGSVSAVCSSIDPTVLEGDTVITPTSVSCIASSVAPTVVQSSITITPTASSAIAGGVDPTVSISELAITPTPASCIAGVGGLAVNLNGDIYCLALPNITIASALEPTVLELAEIIVSLTVESRGTSWTVGERSGFYIVQNILFEDGVIMEFEDGDEVTWGASRSGYSLPARDLDFTLVSDRSEE